MALGSNLFRLTKPKIMLLVLTAGASAIVAEGSMLRTPGRFVIFLLGLFLTGGCANALNQYFERRIDSMMVRTSGKRPLPLGSITPFQALFFSIVIGGTGVIMLSVIFNPLTGILSLGTIIFYGFIYTLWLKPRTSQNIVIGGIAGAMAPVGAWTAATGTISLMPWFMFLLIFLWTPPHFWSLALCFKDDYIKTKLPMMPVVEGDRKTLNLILFYAALTALVSLAPLAIEMNLIYLVISFSLGSILVYKSFQARTKKSRKYFWDLFRFSIIYLFVMLAAMALFDKV